MTATGAVKRKMPAHVELERWYRLLLRAYPIRYRRAHGDEIVATLMDTAQPGRRRPARADVADLMRGAVRQWFRLPIGLPAIVAAVLTAAVLGALGAAGGSWLAWQTTADLPSNAEAVQIAQTVTGGPLPGAYVNRFDPLQARPPAIYVFGGPKSSDWTLEAAQGRLRSDGWILGLAETSTFVAYEGEEPLNAVAYTFEATRGGHTVTVDAHTIRTRNIGTSVSTEVRPTASRWEPAAIVLGWLVGAVIGWLLTGWAGYRLRRRGLPRRLAVLALGITALGLAARPAIYLYEALGHLATTEPELHGMAPVYYRLVIDPSAELVVATLVSGLAILVLAATARPRPTRRDTPTVA